MKTGDKYNPYMIFQGCIVPNCIMKRTDLTASAKLCFGRLSQYAGHNGFCYPSQKQLAEEIGTSESVIKTALTALINAKLLVIEKPTGEKKLMHFRNIYKFVWNEEFLETAKNDSSISRIPAVGEAQIRLSKKENHIKENHLNIYQLEDENISSPATLVASNTVKSKYTDFFEMFWKSYPKTEGKADAFKAWNKLQKLKILPIIEIILKAVEKKKRCYLAQHDKDFDTVKWKYFPNASTWLNGMRWEDVVEEPKKYDPFEGAQ